MSNERLLVGVIVIVLSVTDIPMVTLEVPLLRIILLDVAVAASTFVLKMTTIGELIKTFVAAVLLLRSVLPDLILITESGGVGFDSVVKDKEAWLDKLTPLSDLRALLIISE